MSADAQTAIRPEIEQILSATGAESSELARTLRSLLLERLSAIREFPDVRDRQIGYGFGPGYKDLICMIWFSRSGLSLAFYRAVGLPDPDGLFFGSGKVHKSVRIESLSDIRRPALHALLSHALAARTARRSENDR